MKLQELLELRDLPKEEIRRRYGIQPEHVEEEAEYGKLEDLTLLHNPLEHPARFFFEQDKFAILYLAKAPDLNAAQLLKELGGEGEKLRSRAGKQYIHHVFPEQGVAFSTQTANPTEVRILEIFPPQSLAAYKKRFYSDPGTFKK